MISDALKQCLLKFISVDTGIVPLSVSYMGTKRSLAPIVSSIVKKARPGPFLDAFSGLCAVAKEVAPERQTWTNDCQHFAQTVAEAHFCAQSLPVDRLDAVANLHRRYSEHVKEHTQIANKRISDEHRALDDEDHEGLNAVYAEWLTTDKLEGCPKLKRDATLFRDIYAGSYFGLMQCIEIDALRSAIDDVRRKRRINADEHRWMVLALAVAMNRCSASTGHFAQPLTAKKTNFRRFREQRSRSIRDCFLDALEGMAPVGTRDWRANNVAIRDDAISAIRKLSKKIEKPAVIYADPPYTTDQYSRYYHLYETLILYDYPVVEGKGRYRPGRIVSDFCLATKVSDAFDSLIYQSAEIGAELVLSYPTNGLLPNSRQTIPEKIKRFYGRKPNVLEISHKHSTMGASKGPGKQEVTEVIYRAKK